MDKEENQNAFDRWFFQREGYGLRAERFYDDVKHCDATLMKEWLIAAYLVGRAEMDQIKDLLE